MITENRCKNLRSTSARFLKSSEIGINSNILAFSHLDLLTSKSFLFFHVQIQTYMLFVHPYYICILHLNIFRKIIVKFNEISMKNLLYREIRFFDERQMKSKKTHDYSITNSGDPVGFTKYLLPHPRHSCSVIVIQSLSSIGINKKSPQFRHWLIVINLFFPLTSIICHSYYKYLLKKLFWRF